MKSADKEKAIIKLIEKHMKEADESAEKFKQESRHTDDDLMRSRSDGLAAGYELFGADLLLLKYEIKAILAS